MKKALFFIGFLVLFLLPSFVPVFAQTVKPGAVPKSRVKAVQRYEESKREYVDSGKLSNGVYTGFTYKNILAATLEVFGPQFAGMTTDDKADTGVHGFLASTVGGMYDAQPAATSIYVADLLQNMNVGIVQPAYAQGVGGLGFNALSPILNTWKTFRDIAYICFVLILLVIGFMIMFRQKIGGQAAVTAQQALPQIVIALITVTFSYAIAALLIDAMYIVMYFLVTYFRASPDLTQGNTFEVLSRLLIKHKLATDGSESVGDFIGNTLGGSWGANAVGDVASIGVLVIIVLVVVFQMFKLFFGLLRVYLEIIIYIAFAPVILMMGAIPGKNPFSQWFRNIAGNLAVFPAILLLLLVFDQIRFAYQLNEQVSGGFMPPYLTGGAVTSTIPMLAGLAIVMAISKLPEEVPKALGASSGGMISGMIKEGMSNFRKQTPAGMAVVGGLTGVPVGAAVGAGIGYKRTGSWEGAKNYAGAGALVGGLTGSIGLAKGPQIASSLVRTGLNQGAQAISSRYINTNLAKVKEYFQLQDAKREDDHTKSSADALKAGSNVLDKASGLKRPGGRGRPGE